MKAHVIKNGSVVNTIEVESLDVFEGLVDASDGGSIGDLWYDGAFSQPVDVATHNARIDIQIRVLESRCVRSMRDVLVATLEGVLPQSSDVETLKTLKAQIDSLRIQRI